MSVQNIQGILKSKSKIPTTTKNILTTESEKAEFDQKYPN